MGNDKKKRITETYNTSKQMLAGNQPSQLEKDTTALAAKPFSDEEVGSMRERAFSPIRSAYANTGREITRQAAISGGAPNTIAALAKTTRDRSSALSDAATNVNAQLAGDIFNAKMGATGMAGQLQGQRQNYGLGLLGSQFGAADRSSEGWGAALGKAALGLGSAFLQRPGGGGGKT